MQRFALCTFCLPFAIALLVTPGPCAKAGGYTYEATDETFLNPERGLYGHAPLVRRTSFARMRESGVSLVYAQIYLPEFRDQPISEERLTEISEVFDRMREAGLKGIVRISYSNRIGEPDAPLARVKEHLSQLAPAFERHRDVIAFFQAGIIGAWGEWHSSPNGLDTPDGRRSVLQLLFKHVPKDRFVQVRTPMFKWEIFDNEIVTEDKAFTSAEIARVGHHNDCFLANETDMGTYPRQAVKLWKDRLAADTRYTPIGGETCRVSDSANCADAQAPGLRARPEYSIRFANQEVWHATAGYNLLTPDVPVRQ